MAAYVFVNITDNHFKVWGYDLFYAPDEGAGETITYWGRIGQPMHKLNKKRKSFDYAPDAYGYAQQKVDEKLWKGYKAIPNSLYFVLIESAKGIAKLISIVEKMGEVHYYEPPKKRKVS